MRGDPEALPAVWDIGLPCGYMSGDLLLTCQVPQGNLGTMMRILINSAIGGRNVCIPLLGEIGKRNMASLLYSSTVRRAESWSLPPTAIVSLV